MFGLGAGEIIIIAILAIVLFGNESLPANLKKAARGWSDLKKVTGDAQRQWSDMRDDVARTLLTEEEVNRAPPSPPPATHLEEPIIQTENGPMRHTADGRLVPVEASQEPSQGAGLVPASLPSIVPAEGAVALGEALDEALDDAPANEKPVSGASVSSEELTTPAETDPSKRPY